MTLPEICLQTVVTSGSWWVPYTESKIVRGCLIQAFIPHFDQLPFTFEPVGRQDPKEHGTAVVKVAPLKVDAPLKPTSLPVAAMTLHDGEVWGAYKAKRRPCVVLGCSGVVVAPELTRGKPNHATAPTFVVAPYFGATPKESRAGYRPEFIERVQRCEYSQFIWDHLPHAGGEPSILRLDQMQPVGAHANAYKSLGFRLSEVAIEVIDDHLSWLIQDGVRDDSLVAIYRQSLTA